uniref:YfiT family bacillithiol transferase n=1 Tax=Paenibacillus terrae TaxID=159743 RepID=UPI0011A7EC87|nr:putative metal-dependent hydrolase [Paenibacillus terrae]
MSDDLKYPIGLCVTKKELNGDERTALIGEIRSLPSKLRQAVIGLSKEQLDTPYRPGGWTVRQVVHHVGDSHMNSLIRLKLALTEDNPVIKPYEEQLWAELADSALPDPEISLDLLEALHVRFVLVLESLSGDQWLRTYTHPASGETNLNEHLCTYAWHGNHHLAHITTLKERMGW